MKASWPGLHPLSVHSMTSAMVSFIGVCACTAAHQDLAPLDAEDCCRGLLLELVGLRETQ